MRFELDADQVALRDAVRDLLDRQCTGEQVRKAVESTEGHDPALWRRMTRELGLAGIAVPEELGGSGAGLVELGVVLGELGRAVVPGPFFSTVVLAVPALLRSGDAEARRAWLPAIVEGDTTATLALAEGGHWDPAEPVTAARPDGERWLLTGTKELVTDGADVDVLLVLCSTPDGPSLFGVSGDAAGMCRTAEAPFDLTRRLARVRLRDTPARLVGVSGQGLDVVRHTLDRAAVLLACEQVGGADRCLRVAGDYATTRVQFDRPIGSFQAIKHMLADLLLEVESARAAADYACWAADHDPDELPWLASMAKAFASDTYLAAARTNIQVHGGIGFTWEHDAHLHLRRATSSAQLLGAPGHHRERLAERIFERNAVTPTAGT